MKTFPQLGYFRKAWLVQVKKIKVIPILNFIGYDKEKAKIEVIERTGWKDYGGKHGESFFTRFYQNYILPEKFGIDKRKAHLSTLINSGQMTREEARKVLLEQKYDKKQFEEDRDYIIKKFRLTEKEFDDIMKLRIHAHIDYPSYLSYHYRLEVKLARKLRPVTRHLKKLLGIKVENNYV